MHSAEFPRCSSKICEDKMAKVHISYWDSSLWAMIIKPANFRLSSFSLNHYRTTAKRTGREETHNKHKLKFITDAQYTNCHTDMTSVCAWTVNTNACTGTKSHQQQKYSFVFLTVHLPAPLISFFYLLDFHKVWVIIRLWQSIPLIWDTKIAEQSMAVSWTSSSN